MRVSRSHGKVGMSRVWTASEDCMKRYRTGQDGHGWRFISLPFRCMHVHCRFPLQPQHRRLRSFLADLLGGAALWAVSGDAGKRVLSPPQAFSGRLCRLDVGWVSVGDVISVCHATRGVSWRRCVLTCNRKCKSRPCPRSTRFSIHIHMYMFMLVSNVQSCWV